MSQFGPDPLGGDRPFGQSPMNAYAPESLVQRPAPWSVAAITAFVLSFLGCLAIPAVLAVVLGIVGIARTSGGRRRGMGFAIASLPISLLTGALSILVMVIAAFLVGVGIDAARIPAIIQVDVSDTAKLNEAAVALREMASVEFRNAVSEEKLREWLLGVHFKFGALTQWEPDTSSNAGFEQSERGWSLPVLMKAKFVNGTASVKITFIQSGWFGVDIDDIEIDGVSPK